MATGKESRQGPNAGRVGSNDAVSTRGIRVCYVGTPTEGAGETGLLSELGARVERFGSAEQGFNAVLETDFDLLLVNLNANTGGMGGPEFIRLIRGCGHPGKSQLPIVAIASQRQLQHAARLQALGADELIGTPIDIAVLHAKIGNLLRNRAARGGLREPLQGAGAKPGQVLPEPAPARGARPTISKDAAVGRQPATGVAGNSLAKEVAPMKQKFDLSQMPPAGGSDPNHDGGGSKGFLERLSDRIMARLAKGSQTPDQPAAPERTPPNFAAAPNNVAPRGGGLGAGAADSEADQISEVLRGLSRQPAPPERTAPPRAAAPTATRPAPSSTTLSTPNRAASKAAAPAATSSSGDTAPRQPYVSPIRRPVPQTPPRRVDPEMNPPSAAAAGKLSETEKNRVYDRVKKLVSTARRATDPVSPMPTKPGAAKSLRICFLEDSCTSSHAIREMLGEHGHEVDHFSQAEEAFDAFEEKHYDLLLASQIEAVGGMDCAQLLRKVRRDANEQRRRVPILVLTALGDPKNLQTFREAGANEVIVKPVEGKRLHEQIMRVVTTRPAAPPAAARDKKNLKVCFLEDSCTSSHAIREMLGDEHHEVDHFSSAEEALDAVMEKGYDVLLASQIVALGGMDCLGLIQTIRSSSDPAKREMPIVAITANPDSANLEPFFIAGASDVVLKPIEGKELNRRLLDTIKLRSRTQTSAPNGESSQPVGALKVCFLEDSCTSSHAIREMLGEKGHEVDHFSSAEEALDALSEKNYDVLLASQIVALGGMDCEQLVRTIRAGGKRNLPVTVITANPEPENIDKFQRAGANDVIIKPVEGPELNERLLSIVRAKSAPMPVATPQALPKKLHVCFLEDSCTSSHAIREMLGEQGHEVDHFSTAEEALDAFQDIDYDVLLASQIPSVGGLDTEGLVRRVRAAAGAKKQRPVVLLTTDASPENQQRFRRAGVNDVVVKPVEGNLAHRLLDVVARGRAVPAAAPEQRAPVPVPDHLRVCFLEDSCTSSHAIREMLGEAGHEVDHFSSAEEALDAMLEKPYDVLLASQIVALGGLDCEGLVKSIRGHGKSAARHVPIVVITANGEPANVESFMRVGADSVVIKPIEGNLGDQLKQVVGRVLNQPASPQLRVVQRGRPELPKPSVTAPAPAPTPAAGKPAAAKAPPSGTPPNTAGRVEPSKRIVGLLDTSPETSETPSVKKPVGGASELPRIKLPGMPDVSAAAAKPAVPRVGSGPERKVIAAMFAVGIVAVVAMNWHHFGESTPVNVVAVERGPIYSSLNAPGMIVSKKKVELTTSVPGQITKVLAKEGDKVTKGDVLATLDDRDARIQMQRAEANLESARKDVALNERTMDRLVRALQMGAVSRQMAEDAEAAVNAARAKQRVAEEEFRAAQLLAERLNVTAPFDGVVTANFAVEGLWAEPPGPLFTVVDMDQREIELHIDAADINRVTVGQRVTLSSDAAPGQWTEQVVRVAPAASRLGAMTNVINVYTTLGPEAPPLRYGQQVDGQIRIAASENAVKIPFAALTTRNQRSVVGIIDDGRLTFIPVVTGIESGTHVEIREGLKAGDQVILINKELEDGVHVSPVELHD